MTKSASSRISMGDALSPVTATSMISPMIDETGPIWGVIPRGSWSRTRDSFSATSCRER
jgi:hypothetical protein